LLAASSYGTYNGSAIWLVMALVNPLSLADCAIELKRIDGVELLGSVKAHALSL